MAAQRNDGTVHSKYHDKEAKRVVGIQLGTMMVVQTWKEEYEQDPRPRSLIKYSQAHARQRQRDD